MTVQLTQLNTSFKADSSNKRTVISYREKEGTVDTTGLVKPLPPKGHLVDDDLVTGTKYFFKDIAYDMKSVRNGYKGIANDHQLGRINDVGLRLGGIAIATYLASQTSNPKARLMEYIGLAAFLASMDLYPKIAINAPAKMLHGYDIDKQYIDDQGRKKSVHQDSNYIPYDMYNGYNKGEDLDAIGDKMGIPRDIKNRHDVIREQMRKVATQNNTLWMLTAGLATPIMTALFCCGLEKYVIAPGVEKARNAKYNSQIESLLKQSQSAEIPSSSLGEGIKKFVEKYEGKLIPQEETGHIISILTQDTDSILAEGIKADVENLLSENKIISLNDKILSDLYTEAEHSMQGAKAEYIRSNILPSLADIENMIKEIKPESDILKGVELTESEFAQLRSKILNAAEQKMGSVDGAAANHKDYIKSNVVRFCDNFKAETSAVTLSKENGEKLIKFADIIGDFRKKSAMLDKCENFKFEHAEETILANYYGKFQNTLTKQLDISPKDYKRMSNDKEFAQKVLDEKIAALCQNEKKYTQTFEKLGKILTDMETALHGAAEDTSHILDLITATENVYNNAAENLAKNNIGKETCDRLVRGGYGNTISSREELQKLMDGVLENKFPDAGYNDIDAAKYFAGSKGSSKNLRISRLVSRYQGEVNSFYRILHAMDFYKRAGNFEELIRYSSVKDPEYVKYLENYVKKVQLNGSIADYITKLGIENAYMYKDLYNVGWSLEDANHGSVRQKGIITDSARDALNKNGKTNLAERLQLYITRFKNIIANDTTDFTKPNHIIDGNISKKYSDIARTNEAKFNLVAQSPVDMIQKAAAKKQADRKWLLTAGIMACCIFGVTLLAQFGFGKIKNKQNLQKIDTTHDVNVKQVRNETK